MKEFDNIHNSIQKYFDDFTTMKSSYNENTFSPKINVYEKFDKVIRKSVELGSAIILLDKSLEQYMGNTVTGGDNIKAILMPTLNNAMIYLDKVCSKVNKNT